QRLLLWGDPAMAAAYSRAAGFCGSAGLELFEPLSFKGRKGSGLPGGRDAYADAALRPPGGDFEKYAYTYRVWGRFLYQPDAAPEVLAAGGSGLAGDARKRCRNAPRRGEGASRSSAGAGVPATGGRRRHPERSGPLLRREAARGRALLALRAERQRHGARGGA